MDLLNKKQKYSTASVAQGYVQRSGNIGNTVISIVIIWQQRSEDIYNWEMGQTDMKIEQSFADLDTRNSFTYKNICTLTNRK